MQNRLGRRLGNYRLKSLLARGGFAEVYLGQHIYLNHQVAIKVLLTLPSGKDQESFLAEARTVVNLIHPNIVRVLEFGIEEEAPFLVMEYAPGGSLRQRFPRGTQLPLSLVAAYVRQAAGALQYAHDQRLIHRDIKPENMLLKSDHELLISDFGIAVFAHSSLSQSTQPVVGTVPYMAPEQVQGKPRPASDQYALAVVAYEWLCGERPFHGTLAEIATQQLFSIPPPLREKAPAIPPAVEQVIMTALAKDSRQRYSSMLEFADAFVSASQSMPQLAQTVLDSNVPLRSQTPDFGYENSVLAATSSATLTGKEQSGGDAPTDKTGRIVVGGSRKQQVFAVVLGVLLYTLSSNFVLLLHLSPGTNLLWVLPALIVPVAFGCIYGWWAGLVTGGLGYFLGSSISLTVRVQAVASSPISFLTLSALQPPWYFHLGFLAVGTIAGLVTLFTKGHYESFRHVALAGAFSIAGILVGFFLVFNGFWPHLYPNESLLTDLTHIALPNIIVVLLLLPPVLALQRFFTIRT